MLNFEEIIIEKKDMINEKVVLDFSLGSEDQVVTVKIDRQSAINLMNSLKKEYDKPD